VPSHQKLPCAQNFTLQQDLFGHSKRTTLEKPSL
jgi:hypothetical protein